MSIPAVLAFIIIVFVLAWRFEDRILGVLPYAICTVGLVLYILAFFRRLSYIDWVLIAGGLFALYSVIREVRKQGVKTLLAELKRQFCDVHLWVCIALLLIMCILLRGVQLLEWDGYNFWGPDTKSLYYRDGFAPLHSNVASGFGDYPPMAQLIFWWFSHIAGGFSEQNMFIAYYVFGALLMFSVADRFRVSKGPGKVLLPVFACLGAVVLPGVVCTAWFRALYVDPLMAMLFGAVCSLIVCRPSAGTSLWKAKILVAIMYLVLIKSVGLLWGVFAFVFFCFWWLRDRKEYRFSLICLGGIAASYGSWSVFCSIMERSNYLTAEFSSAAADRLSEIGQGVFLSAGNNWGYITSFARAFFLAPMHRENTFAVDLTPALLIVFLFAAATVLYKYGFVPKKKLGRLLGFMALCNVVIYTVHLIGHLTFFYFEEQYLDPVNMVTLMTRYCAPANMGLLMLLCSFASGQPVSEGQSDGTTPLNTLTSRRRVVAAILTGVFIFSCGAYTGMGRRFINDPLDESRVELRQNFVSLYGDFIEAVQNIPLEELNEERTRVLLCYYDMPINPIVTNEASPVSFNSLELSGDDGRDISAVFAALDRGRYERFLYVSACENSFADALSAYTENGLDFEINTLYEVHRDEETWIMLRVYSGN